MCPVQAAITSCPSHDCMTLHNSSPTAAQVILGGNYGNSQHREDGDYQTYAIGRIHKRNVVICLPAGIDDIATAAVMERNMIRNFSPTRVSLVGVCK